jgi:hypothetical protein
MPPADRPRPGRLSGWGRIALVALIAYGVIVIVPDTLRPLLTVESTPGFLQRWYPLGILGFQADNDGKVISVDAGATCHEWTAPASKAADGNPANAAHAPEAHAARTPVPCPAWSAGIREGDTIDLKAPETFRRAVNGLVFVAPHEPVRLKIASATGGGSRVVTLMPAPEEMSGWQRLWLLIAQLSSIVVFIGFCGYLVWQHPTAETWGLFLYSVWFNSGQYFVWYANLPERGLAVFDVLQCLFQALGLVGLLLFALHFPMDSVAGWRRACQPLLVVPFLALLGAGLWGFCNFFFGWPTETAYRLYYYITYGIYFAIAVLFWYTYRTQPGDRPKIRWVILGASWGLLCFLIADTYEATSMVELVRERLGIRIPQLYQSFLDFLYMQNAWFPLTVIYAVRHHRVIKVRLAVTRGTVVMIALVLSLSFVGYLDMYVDEPIKHFLKQSMPRYVDVLILALIWLTLFLLREHLYDFLESILARKWHAAERRLEALVDRLEEPHGITRDEVNRALTVEPVRALDLTSAALFRRRADGAFEFECGVHWPADVVGVLDSGHPVVTALTNEPKPLHASDWGPERLFPELEEPALAAPVLVDRVVTRIVVFGPHTTGEDLDRDEVKVIRHLSRAAAVAYGHLETEELRREVEELRGRLHRGPAGGAPTD